MTFPQPGDRCLSIRQPFCHLLAAGVKRVENRSRLTRIRGRIWLHASQTLACSSWSDVIDCGDPPLSFDDELDANGIILPALPELTLGAIIGSAYLYDCMAGSAVTSADDPEGFADPAAYCWLFREAELLPEPIRATGRVGWWRYKGNSVASHPVAV